MSYTELFRVSCNGRIEGYATFRNSHRGAGLCWLNMCERHLRCKLSIMDDSLMRKTWDLWKMPEIPLAHRIVLASTFDNVMVRKENLPRLIAAIETYVRDFNDPGTLQDQIKPLTELSTDGDCYAVCWNQTSVSADVWYIHDDEDGRPYDINRDEGHWFLFDELEDGELHFSVGVR